MRSLESIVDSDSSLKEPPLPESAESDSPEAGAENVQSVAHQEGEKAEPAAKEPEKAPRAGAQAKAAGTAAGADEGEGDTDAVDPVDLAGFKKALHAARGDKRKFRKQWQETERKLAMLEGQLSVLHKQGAAQPSKEQAKPAEPTKEQLEAEYWADPVAFTQKYGRSQQGPSPEEVALQTKVQLSVYYTKKAHADYDDKLAVFAKAAERAPYLWEQANASPDPGGFVYEHGSQLLELEQFGGDMGAWREAERAKLRAEIEAEAMSQGRQPAVPAAKPTIPKSNASARGTGAGSPQAWAGPRSTSDVFGH